MQIGGLSRTAAPWSIIRTTIAGLQRGRTWLTCKDVDAPCSQTLLNLLGVVVSDTDMQVGDSYGTTIALLERENRIKRCYAID